MFIKFKPRFTAKVHLKAGDLFYLPIFWWHAVQGSIGRNMILNWWCQQHPFKEYKYKGFEGTQEILEVLQHLNEAWSENPSSGPSAEARAVAQELGTGALYSDSMCASSDSYKKLLGPIKPPRNYPMSTSLLPSNGFRWKSRWSVILTV